MFVPALRSAIEKTGLTAPFNNVDSEVQNATNRYTFYSRQSLRGPLRKGNNNVWLNRIQRSCSCTDWRISIHFVGFCIFCCQSVVAVIMIDSSKARKSLAGVEV